VERAVKKYLKKQTPKRLHKLRIKCRKKISLLQKDALTDKGCEEILKLSSRLRDTDVLIKICKSEKIKKLLKKKRKKLNKKFIKKLKKIKFKTTPVQNSETLDLLECKKLLKKSFIPLSDKELHNIRLKIKICRYTNKKYEKVFKKIQDMLGKAHDYYKCQKLAKKYNKNMLIPYFKKREYVVRAEKAREEALGVIG